MSPRTIYLIAVTVGTTAGSFLPGLWGAGPFSGWGIIMSTAGGFFAIWIAYRYMV